VHRLLEEDRWNAEPRLLHEKALHRVRVLGGAPRGGRRGGRRRASDVAACARRVCRP